jgi:cation diffusion facilitator family transporter
MTEEAHATKHIVQSLVVNFVIAAIKAFAAFFTKSGAMTAEALHSFSDCGNQVLLLIGVKRAARPADDQHPFGYGRALYFWSFLVALMLFSGGGVFSIYEGIHKLLEPSPVEHIGIGIAILVVSLVLEGYATFSNVKELNRRKGKSSFLRFLRITKDSDLVVVFCENAAAVLGLLLAIVAMGLASVTGDGRFDAGGTLAIGLVLVGVAVFLAVKIQSLLIGESADPEIHDSVHRACKSTEGFCEILHVRSVQQGPGEVLLALKASFEDALTPRQIADAINVFEAQIRKAHPEVQWIYVEPDVRREPLEAHVRV